MSLLAYRNHAENSAATMTRIDLILRLYDAVLGHLEAAVVDLRDAPLGRPVGNEESSGVRALLQRCEVAMLTLASTINNSPDNPAFAFLQLYEFVAHCIATATTKSLRDAIDILTTLRQSFEAVRDQALELERIGEIPPLESSQFRALA